MPNSISDCTSYLTGDIKEWASRCLTQIAHHFSPLPKFFIVNHKDGLVFVTLIQRSDTLIPLAKGGTLSYHIRIHDQTLEAPDYLLGDILLGKRKQPIVRVKKFCCYNFRTTPTKNYYQTNIDFDLSFQIENSGLTWVDECRWGILYLIEKTETQQDRLISNHLLSHINFMNTQINNNIISSLCHKPGLIKISEPFDIQSFKISFSTPFNYSNSSNFKYLWKAAFYILSKNMRPVWYQICLEISEKPLRNFDKENGLLSPSDYLTLTRLYDELPIVTWDMIA